ncbi:hypothetical protein PGT21_009740 [Puccinia graminis f. sp. tritici]|uniref:Uncharacterized protein n=1 Tax=Puccinia graminis f. sp. tritici TaxID=56615 RepID=A0A5B0N5W1_PUCGR|nr:hypothetical protein PGT21_009740 [Puccinia graminis f. sp. tritici]
MCRALAVYTLLLSVILSAFATRSLMTNNCPFLLAVLILPAASSMNSLLKPQVTEEGHAPEIIYNHAVNDEEEVNREYTILTWSDRLLTSADDKHPVTKILNWVPKGQDILSAKPIISVKHHTTNNILELNNLMNLKSDGFQTRMLEHDLRELTTRANTNSEPDGFQTRMLEHDLRELTTRANTNSEPNRRARHD